MYEMALLSNIRQNLCATTRETSFGSSLSNTSCAFLHCSWLSEKIIFPSSDNSESASANSFCMKARAQRCAAMLKEAKPMLLAREQGHGNFEINFSAYNERDRSISNRFVLSRSFVRARFPHTEPASNPSTPLWSLRPRAASLRSCGASTAI